MSTITRIVTGFPSESFIDKDRSQEIRLVHRQDFNHPDFIEFLKEFPSIKLSYLNEKLYEICGLIRQADDSLKEFYVIQEYVKVSDIFGIAFYASGIKYKNGRAVWTPIVFFSYEEFTLTCNSLGIQSPQKEISVTASCGHALDEGDAIGWPVVVKDTDSLGEHCLSYKTVCKDCFEAMLEDREICCSSREEQDWLDEEN